METDKVSEGKSYSSKWHCYRKHGKDVLKIEVMGLKGHSELLSVKDQLTFLDDFKYFVSTRIKDVEFQGDVYLNK